MGIFLKSATLSAWALWIALAPQAQENRFLYLQTDDGQPFYVKSGGVHHSSTLSGFLILSRLQDTALDLVLGFPRDMYPAQSFRVSPVDRDRGLVLKRREDGRWVLFDLHTMEATLGEEVLKEPTASRQALPAATTDSFTTMLSTAIGDSSLLETRVTGGRNGETNTGKQAASVTTVDSSQGKRMPPPVPVGSEVSPVSAKQRSETSSATVNAAASASLDSLKGGAEARPAARVDSAVVPVQTTVPDVDSTRSRAPAPAPTDNRPGAERPTVDPVSGARRADRTDCKSSQTVKQLGDLRRRMESIRDEEAKVAEAVRELRLRCFTTEQVRSLLVVFGREEGRFKLLDAAYPHVQDPSAYPALLSILKDPYFIHRFKRLTGMPVE